MRRVPGLPRRSPNAGSNTKLAKVGLVVVASLATAAGAARAGDERAPDRARFDTPIARLAQAHGVPERLIRRIIMRESRYAPHLSNHGHYGLMQIKLQTARGMGFHGTAAQLLDGETNLVYAVPYLANAYAAADRNEDRAVQLYAGGYHFVARRKGLLPRLRTADSAPLKAEPAVAYAAPPAPPPASPFAFLFGNSAPNPPVQQDAQAAPADDQAAAQETDAQPTALTSAPLPPRRPRGL